MAEQTGIKTVYEIRIEQGQALKEFERLNKSLLEVRAKKVELNKENKAAIAQEILLEKAIALEGVATKEQAAQLVKLKAERTLTNKAISEATIVERALASQTRELGNDLGRLTAAGTRFRDKMAGAFATAIEGTTAFQQLANQSQQLESTLKGIDTAIERNAIQLQTLNNELKEGAITEEQYTEQTKKLNSELEASKAASTLLTDELGKVTQRSDELDKKLEALNAEFNAGKINQEQYKASLKDIEVETRRAGEATTTLTSKFDQFTSNQGKELKSTLSSLALQYVGVGAAIDGAQMILGSAIDTIVDFNAKLAVVSALGGEYKTNITELGDAAKDIGAKFGIGATEALTSVEALAKAGVSAADILGGGLEGALTLAAAGELEAGAAAEFASSALAQFGLVGSDVVHVADLLAAAANKAQGDVSDFGNALKFVGPVAESLGVSIDETVGTLAAFAQSGILGEQAGTSLRGVLSSLTSPSKLATEELERLGVVTEDGANKLFDAQGQFKGLANLAEVLKESTSNLTVEERANSLGRIFGNQQLTAANILLKEGEKGLDNWTGAVNDQGIAARISQEKLDSLKGSTERLDASWQRFVLSIEDGSGKIGKTVSAMAEIFGGALDFLAGDDERTKKIQDFTSKVQTEFEKIGGVGKLVATEGDEVVNTMRLLTESVKDFGTTQIDTDLLLLKGKEASEALRQSILNGDKIQEASARAAITAITEAINKRKEVSEVALNNTLVAKETAKQEAASIETVKDRREALTAALEDAISRRDQLAATDLAGIAIADVEVASAQKAVDALTKKTKATKELSEAEKARAELSKSIAAESGAADIAKLPEQQQEVAQATAKRDERVEIAQGDTALLLQIEEAYQREVLAIRNNYGAQQTAAFDAQESELLTRQVEGYRQELDLLIKSQQDAIAAAPVGNRNEMLEQQAQERLVIITNIQNNERTLLLQQFDTERADAEAAGTDLIALKKQQGEELVALEVQFAVDRAEAQGIDKDALATIQQQYKLEQIQGVVDFNTQKALVQAEFDAGVIKSKEELNAKLDQLDKEAQENTLAATSNLFSSLQAISDAGFDKRISEQSDKLTELKTKLANANTDQEKEEIRSQISRVESEKTALEKRKKSNQTFAIAAALINTYLAATNALSTVVPTVPAGVIAAAAVVAGGLLQVSKIAGFAEGGDVKSGDVTSSWGPSVTRPNGDNVLVRAGRGFVTLKTGEKVLNADQQRELEQRTHPSIWGDIGLPGHTRRSMNQFRVAYMGHGYATGGTVGQIAPRPSPSTVVQNQFISSMESFANRPVTVGVDEIARVQGRVSVIEAAGSL